MFNVAHLLKWSLYTMRMTIGVVIGEALMNKNIDEAYTLIEVMVQSSYQWGSNHRSTK